MQAHRAVIWCLTVAASGLAGCKTTEVPAMRRLAAQRLKSAAVALILAAAAPRTAARGP